MITVKGRDLIIPVNERQIGTTYDNNAETRRIRMERAPGGIDLAHLTYRLDLEYIKDIKDTCNLEKELQDDGIILVWTVPASCVAEAGTVWISVRGLDANGSIKWASNKGALYVYDTVNTPGTYSGSLTELEQLEANITGKMERIESGEEEREANEKIREQQEKSRQEASAEAVSAVESAVQNAQTAAGKAESAADDTRSAIEDAGTAADAARQAAASVGEYRDQARQYAEAAEQSNTEAEGHEESAAEYAQQALQHAGEAAESAGAAEASASSAEDYAKLSQRYAEGHEEYPGSDVDNSEYYCRLAQQAKEAAEKARDEAENIVGIDIMTPEKAGIGKPDDVTVKVSEDGTLSVPSATAESAGIVRPDGNTIGISGEGLLELTADAGKVPATDTLNLLGLEAGNVTTQMLLDAVAERIANKLVTNEALQEKLLNYISVDKIVADFLSDDPKSVLAASLGKSIDARLTELLENYTQLNSDVTSLNSSRNSGMITRLEDANDGIMSAGDKVYFYIVSWGKNTPNPSHTYFIIHAVAAVNNDAVQLAIGYKGTGGEESAGKIFTRYCFQKTWSEWIQQ